MGNRGYPIRNSREVVRQGLGLEEHMKEEIRREKNRVRRRITTAGIMLAAVYFTAIFAFHALEGWSWEDSVYFTTATITTVGYGDLVPRSYLGRLFSVPLMLVGVGVGLYVIYTIQDYGRSKLDSVAREVELIEERIRNHRKRE